MVQSIWMLCNWYAELDWFSLATLLPVSAQFARDGRNIFPRQPSSPHTLRKDNFFNFGANFLNFGATMTTVTKTDTDTFSWFLVLNASWHVLDTPKKPGGNPVRISRQNRHDISHVGFQNSSYPYLQFTLLRSCIWAIDRFDQSSERTFPTICLIFGLFLTQMGPQ